MRNNAEDVGAVGLGSNADLSLCKLLSQEDVVLGDKTDGPNGLENDRDGRAKDTRIPMADLC